LIVILEFLFIFFIGFLFLNTVYIKKIIKKHTIVFHLTLIKLKKAGGRGLIIKEIEMKIQIFNLWGLVDFIVGRRVFVWSKSNISRKQEKENN